MNTNNYAPRPTRYYSSTDLPTIPCEHCGTKVHQFINHNFGDKTLRLCQVCYDGFTKDHWAIQPEDEEA